MNKGFDIVNNHKNWFVSLYRDRSSNIKIWHMPSKLYYPRIIYIRKKSFTRLILIFVLFIANNDIQGIHQHKKMAKITSNSKG